MRKPAGAMGGGKPIMVIADTVKGKGVSFMEHSVLCTTAPRAARNMKRR